MTEMTETESTETPEPRTPLIRIEYRMSKAGRVRVWDETDTHGRILLNFGYAPHDTWTFEALMDPRNFDPTDDAAFLAMSRMSFLRSLKGLEMHGFVEVVGRAPRVGRGRPSNLYNLYKLTPAGLDCFQEPA